MMNITTPVDLQPRVFFGRGMDYGVEYVATNQSALGSGRIIETLPH